MPILSKIDGSIKILSLISLILSLILRSYRLSYYENKVLLTVKLVYLLPYIIGLVYIYIVQLIALFLKASKAKKGTVLTTGGILAWSL